MYWYLLHYKNDPFFNSLDITFLGAGFRVGFLGLLHMDVFQQRLEQEYNATVVMTSPSVVYKGSEKIVFYSRHGASCDNFFTFAGCLLSMFAVLFFFYYFFFEDLVG